MKILIQLYTTWFKMGLFTFGGGYAMLPIIQREVIEKHHWATEDEIMDYYAIGQCTPGIIAVNTATFIGFKLKGVIGGIVATLGVISPSLIIILLIASSLSNFSELPIVQHALNGIQIAVCALMAIAINKLWDSNIHHIGEATIMLAAFILSYFTDISIVYLVLGAALSGLLISYKSLKKGEQISE